MKIMKLISLIVFFVGVMISAQCTISGSSSMNNNVSEDFSLERISAQCVDCFQWTADNKVVKIVSDPAKSAVTIRSIKAGEGYVAVSYPTENGIEKCRMKISVSDSVDGDRNRAAPATSAYDNKKPTNCDVEITAFKVAKVAPGRIRLLPQPDEHKTFAFSWEVSYVDGTFQNSANETPEFVVSYRNPISKIELKVQEGFCTKTVTKTFSEGYWTFF